MNCFLFLVNIGYNRLMKQHLTSEQVEQTLALAQQAAKQIMVFYQSGYTIDLKKDKSPVTQADLAASKLLEEGLVNIAPYPVLSEESTPKTPIWLDWPTYWLIDPIDGTRHFINATGDFCICIALIHQHQAVFGLIYSPTGDKAWFAQAGDHCVSKYQQQHIKPLYSSAPARLTATLSSAHVTEKMDYLLASLGRYQWHQRGSALKYIDVIEGKATLYPKMWDTCEWDTAAGHCLLECAGGKVIELNSGEPLRYGYKASLLNPYFIAYHHLSREQVGKLLDRYQQMS